MCLSKNALRRTALMLCLCILCVSTMGMTAFAYADDSASIPTEAPAETTPEADAEQPYTYTVSEDGSVTITIDSTEWDFDVEESATIGKVVTNGGRLNLRTGAGMSYEIIDQLRCGEEVTVLGSEGEWYQVIVPEKIGYVHSRYLEVLEAAEETGEFDAAMLMLMMSMIFQNADTETEVQPAFTPDGNLTLIDDILQTEVPAGEDTELQEKQFITVQSKNGNYFYLVIDRSGDTENVYFLNMVDEADLMALMEDGTVPICACKDKCEAGAVNTACEVCKTNMTECVGKEKVVEPEPMEEPKPAEEKPGNVGLMLILLLVLGGGGAAVWWFKFRKPKPDNKGPVDLDDYDYGDEDDEDYETENTEEDEE